MPLRGVHKKRMAQIHRAGLSQRQFFSPLGRPAEPTGGEFAQGQASFTGEC
jgi:hypothetical protein